MTGSIALKPETGTNAVELGAEAPEAIQTAAGAALKFGTHPAFLDAKGRSQTEKWENQGRQSLGAAPDLDRRNGDGASAPSPVLSAHASTSGFFVVAKGLLPGRLPAMFPNRYEHGLGSAVGKQ